MKMITNRFALMLWLVIVSISNIYAQAYNRAFTIQALNRTTNSSAISRSLGGIKLTSQNDVTVMFANPAALQSLEGIQFSAGGSQEFKENKQTQEWYKLDWMPLFDLFIEGLTEDIRDPVINPDIVPYPTYQDTLPHNGRTPNWSRKNDQFNPVSIFAAVPFELSGMKLTAGIGFVEYANVDYYYENRTAFNRNLDYITLPGTTDPNPESAEWWGDTRLREGSIKGYGGALSAAVTKNLTVGLSGLYISGTIDDEQSREGYGRIDFFNKDFRYTPDSYVKSWTGTSDISAFDLSLSSVFQTKNLKFGISIKPSTKISRDFKTTGDSTSSSTTTALAENIGIDEIRLPWRGAIGLGITPRPNVFIGIEYKYNPYGKAEYTDKNGTVTKPWMDCSSFHMGVELLPVNFISIRVGYQRNSEVFESQGNPLHGDPISYAVYSAGFGIRFLENIQLNFGYEYLNLHYEDRWRLNTNVNKDIRNTVFSSISYTIK